MHANYLSRIFDRERLLVLVENVIDKCTEHGIDAIVVSGLSGTIVGGAVTIVSNVGLIAVRKGETTHSSCMVEYKDFQEYKKIAFLDDLISSGTTYKRVKRALKGEGMKISLIMLYEDVARTFDGLEVVEI